MSNVDDLLSGQIQPRVVAKELVDELVRNLDTVYGGLKGAQAEMDAKVAAAREHAAKVVLNPKWLGMLDTCLPSEVALMMAAEIRSGK